MSALPGSVTVKSIRTTPGFRFEKRGIFNWVSLTAVLHYPGLKLTEHPPIELVLERALDMKGEVNAADRDVLDAQVHPPLVEGL